MFETFENNTVREKAEDEYSKKVIASLEAHDSEKELAEELISRLVLLEKESKFNEDSRKIERGMENVLDLLEERHADRYPQLRFSKEQKADAKIAAILHDIGKSGPVEATPAEQEAIVKIFALEKPQNPDSLVMEIIPEIFGDDKVEDIGRLLKNCGIDEKTTMRQFWDKHAYWTHDILEKYPQGLAKRARIIAASHHIDHGINPYGLPESEIPMAANIIGTLEDYVETLERRALIALDQYEASVRRGSLSHEEALGWVRKNLAKFEKDELMNLLLDAIDELGKRQEIFTQKKSTANKFEDMSAQQEKPDKQIEEADEKQRRKERRMVLASELSYVQEAWRFPGIDPDSYAKLKAEEEELLGFCTPIDELIRRFENEGMKVVIVPWKNNKGHNIHVLPFGSDDIENDSIPPEKLQITEFLHEDFKEFILLSRG
ncbi:MAG TPA: hypothetical protein DD454_04615 [Candidatus Moranbacteria bacterium]|nr:hypothetical protein [Candidatus Moranbacteria bacterium]